MCCSKLVGRELVTGVESEFLVKTSLSVVVSRLLCGFLLALMED